MRLTDEQENNIIDHVVKAVKTNSYSGSDVVAAMNEIIRYAYGFGVRDFTMRDAEGFVFSRKLEGEGVKVVEYVYYDEAWKDEKEWKKKVKQVLLYQPKITDRPMESEQLDDRISMKL